MLGARYLKNIESKLNNEIQHLKEEKYNLHAANLNLQKTIDSMQNAKLWKLTYPYRILKNKIEWQIKHFQKNPMFNPTKSKFLENSNISNLRSSKSSNTEIAVILHAYYLSEIQEIIDNLNFINIPFDLYVTSPESIDASIFSEISNLKNLKIEYCENKGRDILPFIQMLKKFNFYEYAFILKIHTKKSEWLNRTEKRPLKFQSGGQWKKTLLKDLLGSKENFINICAIFAQYKEIGVLAPEDTILSFRKNIAGNKLYIWEIMNILGVRFTPLNCKFPAGSMYWFRPEVFPLKFMYQLNESNFQEEENQTDSTFSHGFERLVGVIAKKSKFRLSGYKFKEINE